MKTLLTNGSGWSFKEAFGVLDLHEIKEKLHRSEN